MTLEQLTSPKVTEWIDNYNHRLNEGQEYSEEKMFEEFDEWFGQHENEINESIKLDEGRFSSLLDDDDDDDDEDKPSADPEPESGESEDEPEPDALPDEESEEEEEEISHDPRSKVRVDNSSAKRRNVFTVVNHLYNLIDNEGKNMDKVTYLKFLDTSNVNDMTALLAFTNLPNADLSTWNTSGVRHMEGMFYKSTFNNDSICNWNVSSCGDFKNMFFGSKFNQSLAKWKTKMITVKEPVYDKETGERVGTEEVEKRTPLPFVGAYEDEETEIEAGFWKDRFKDGVSENKQTKSKYNNLLDFNSFMVNEGLWDKTKEIVKKGVDKVKSLFKVAALKLSDYFVSFLGENGEPVPATNPYTALNYISKGEVAGVKAYSPVKNSLLNDEVKSDAENVGGDEYYNIFDKSTNSREYENFKTFMEEVKKIEESEGKRPFDVILNEDRIGFSAKSGGLRDIADIDTKALRDEIKWRMMSTPGSRGKDAMGALLIWGAPGVGKSTIPNAIIDAYNENAKSSGKELKSLIVAQCGDMTPDGFALPMPVRVSMKDYVESRPAAKKLAHEFGLGDDVLAKSIITRSDDAPKMWIPCYKPDPDKRINEVRKMIANGHVREYYNKDGEYVVEETTDGGIIMFDEFFRADPSIFKILMQILLNRSYGGFTIGDKWGIIACSNRPNDDEEVDTNFGMSGAVVTTRVTQFNFVPDFKDWKKWAETKGHFDELTLGFLVNEKDSNGEYSNWHNIDTEEHKEGKVVHPTPRTWSMLMSNLWNIMKNEGYESIDQIPEDTIRRQCDGTIGSKMGEKYVDWLKNAHDTVLNIGKVFSDAAYIVPEPIPSAAEMSEKVINYIEANYSKDELPSEEYLMNMFNLLNKTYSKAKDNYIKEMHIRIFDLLIDKKTSKQFKTYIKSCLDRYQLDD